MTLRQTKPSPSLPDRTGARPGALWLPAALTALLGTVLSFVALRPGTMARDSFVMYGMAVDWEFNDWHHPYIPVLMALSRSATGDTSLLLLLQLCALWAGIYIFALSMRQQIGAWALVSMLIGVTPVVLSQAGFLHKTPLQTALFLFAFGPCFFYYSLGRRPSLLVLPAILLALFVGAAIRSYSYLSAVPLLLFLGHLLLGGNTRRSAVSRSVSFALLALMLFVLADRLIVYELLNARRTYKVQTVFRYDLAGVIARTGVLYGAPALKKEYSTPEAIAKRYEEEDGLYRVGAVFRPVATRTELAYLFREWLRAIHENPQAYVHHRMHAISRSLGIHTPRMLVLRTEGSYKQEINRYGLGKETNVLWKLLREYVEFFHGTVLYKPWFWFVCNIVALGLAVAAAFGRWTPRNLLPHLLLLSSGSVFFLIYPLVCLHHDLRFVYWGIVSTAFGGFGIGAAVVAALVGQGSTKHGA